MRWCAVLCVLTITLAVVPCPAETGGEVRVWLKHGDTFFTFPIESLDTQAGRAALGDARNRKLCD